MEKFNDFIIGDFIDSYRNLTLKTFTGYRYVNEYCNLNDLEFILMQDDDTLINEKNFENLLKKNDFGYPLNLKKSSKTNPHDLFGDLLPALGQKIVRIKLVK